MIFQTCGCIAVDKLWLLFTQYKTTGLPLSAVTVSLHYLPRYLPSTASSNMRQNANYLPRSLLEVNHVIVNAIKTNRRIRFQVRPHGGVHVNSKLTTE